MPGFSVILVPTDLLAPAAEVLAVARSLARRGARLIVLPVALAAEGPPGPRPTSMAHDPSLRLEYATRPGPPAEAIIALAEELGCELILIGPTGADGTGLRTLELAAQEVLRRASCPVLCLPVPAGPESMPIELPAAS